MLELFTREVQSIELAQQLLQELMAENLLFHPEDAPASVIDSCFGTRLFTDEEAILLDQRMCEMYQYMPNPCAYAMELLQGKLCES